MNRFGNLINRFMQGRGAGQPFYDMQNYVYFKCPTCGQKMRAPRGRGKIKIKCRNCGSAFNKKV